MTDANTRIADLERQVSDLVTLTTHMSKGLGSLSWFTTEAHVKELQQIHHARPQPYEVTLIEGVGNTVHSATSVKLITRSSNNVSIGPRIAITSNGNVVNTFSMCPTVEDIHYKRHCIEYTIQKNADDLVFCQPGGSVNAIPILTSN